MYGNAQNYNTDFFSLHPQGDAGLSGQPGAPGKEGKRVSEWEQAAACVGQTRRVCVCVTDVTANIKERHANSWKDWRGLCGLALGKC